MQRHFTMTGVRRKMMSGQGTNLPKLVSAGYRRRRRLGGKGVLGDVWTGVKDAGQWVGSNIGNVLGLANKASSIGKLAGVDTSKFDSGLSKVKQASDIIGSRRRRMRGRGVVDDIGNTLDWILKRAPAVVGLAKMAGAKRKRKGGKRHKK